MIPRHEDDFDPGEQRRPLTRLEKLVLVLYAALAISTVVGGVLYVGDVVGWLP